MTPVGVYISVPFCRAKCTFCNFASDNFPASRMHTYVTRLAQEIGAVSGTAARLDCDLPTSVDSIYLGGGTPSLLKPADLGVIFATLRSVFSVERGAEVTLEAAPGQIAPDLLDALLAAGVNRVSLGVQSFVDREARAVGRLHTAQMCLAEIERFRTAGLPQVSVDLIAGLPHQTTESWRQSLQVAATSDVDHISVYMLETDGESRLGTEVERLRSTSQLSVLGQEARYHAAAVPSEDACADLYAQACEALEATGFEQYEISNFARNGAVSHHNCKYWERAPYIGLGLDAHSMLLDSRECAVRFQNPDDLDIYLNGTEPAHSERVSPEQAFAETVFLGLRLVAGISARHLASLSAPAIFAVFMERARELAAEKLLTITGDRIALTAKGRVLSSAVFGELLTITV